jgi:hypothetical protein
MNAYMTVLRDYIMINATKRAPSSQVFLPGDTAASAETSGATQDEIARERWEDDGGAVS